MLALQHIPFGRLFFKVAVWSLFLFSVARALFVIIETNQIDNPFLFADEWVVSEIITTQPFIDASLAGHNKVPCYIQNALWWIDYTWLGYTGILPAIVQIGGWLLGLILFSVVLRAGRVSWTILLFCLSMVLIFWFSLANADQYSFYRWRGVEASLIFLFLSLTLYFVGKFRSYQKLPTNSFSMLAFFAASITSWAALYVHGGFPLLPITLFVLMFSESEQKKYMMLGGGLLTVFISLFLYFAPTLGAQPEVESGTIMLGFLVVLSSLPYTLLKPLVGQQGALCCAGIIGLSALGILGVLLARLIKKKMTTLDIIAFFLLAYSAIIALSITQVRISVHGWEYALSGRYANYSIYVLFGMMFYAVGEILQEDKKRILPTTIAFGCFSLIIPLGALSLIGTIKGVESINAQKMMFEAQMVPYTLRNWLLPPRPHFTNRRKVGGEKIHDTLLEHSSNVFRSLPYKTYFAAERISASEMHLPLCFKKIKPVQKDFIQEGLLAEISLVLEKPWSEVDGSILFTTLSGDAAGWAVRQRCIGCFLQDITGHRGRQQSILGYMLFEEPPFSARALLVNKEGEAVCISDSIDFLSEGQ